MEIKILSETDNRLLLRKEYTGQITHTNEPTPKRLEVREKVAALTNSKPDQTVVTGIKSEFGIGFSKLTFRVYDSIEMMNKIELPYMLKRNGHLKEEEKK